MTAAIRTTASLEAELTDVIIGRVRYAPMAGKTLAVAFDCAPSHRAAPPPQVPGAPMVLIASPGQAIRGRCGRHRGVMAVAQHP
jgi:hypothetical protein